MLGVYPLSQVAVQLSPSAIEVTPAPQYPVEAALAIPVVSTSQSVLAKWQVKAGKLPPEHVTEVLLGA
jgi:hypothetical protein